MKDHPATGVLGLLHVCVLCMCVCVCVCACCVCACVCVCVYVCVCTMDSVPQCVIADVLMHQLSSGTCIK